MMPGPMPMPPNEPLQVTLEAQQWNQLLALLGDTPAPYRITEPLIRAVADQLVRQQHQRSMLAATQAAEDKDNVVPMGAD